MQNLRETARKARGRAMSPIIGFIDSRSVRTSHHIDSSKYGIDGGKKSKPEKSISLLIHLDYQWQSRFMLQISMTA